MSLVKNKTTAVGDNSTQSAALPAQYARDFCFAAKAASTESEEAADRAILLSPEYMTVEISRTGFELTEQLALDLTDADNWDNTDTDYTAAATRAGLDFYLYACNDNGALKLLVSRNSTSPVDSDDSGRWTESNTRKIGGFHCLCSNVGTISGHTLSDYVAGDILPASVWDLKHRPVCSPEGMVYVTELAKWVDIYLTSVSSGVAYSLYNASVATYDWYISTLVLRTASKRLLTQNEFMLASIGSNVNTYTASYTSTGGNSDTNSRRTISNSGIEDCCGITWQWGKDAAGGSESTAWVSVTDQNGNAMGSTYYAPIRALLGGGVGSTTSGPACCYWVSYPTSNPYPFRSIADPL